MGNFPISLFWAPKNLPEAFPDYREFANKPVSVRQSMTVRWGVLISSTGVVLVVLVVVLLVFTSFCLCFVGFSCFLLIFASFFLGFRRFFLVFARFFSVFCLVRRVVWSPHLLMFWKHPAGRKFKHIRGSDSASSPGTKHRKPRTGVESVGGRQGGSKKTTKNKEKMDFHCFFLIFTGLS